MALGVFDEANPRQAIHEWFAERLAHANDTWAKRRTDVRAQGDGSTIGCRITVNGIVKDERSTNHVNGYISCLDKTA